MGQLLVMPKLGLTMTEGTIVEWFKKEGEEVQKGEKIFAVETSKLTNEVEAPASGVLRKIIHKEGKLQVLEPVGILAGADEDISDLLAKAGTGEKKVEEKQEVKEVKQKVEKEKSDTKNKRIKASPKAKRLAKELGVDLSKIEGTGPGGAISEQDVEDYQPEEKPKVKTSPTAEKVAENLGVDINKIEKSERIMKDDVVGYKNFEMLKEMADPKETREKMSNMRSVISERMSQSQQTSAAVHYNLTVDTREMKRLRDKLKPIKKITYTDIIVKVVSRVLLEYPILNCSVEGNEIIKRNYANVGVAVALDEGLIVPVVKYANIKGLKTISDDIKELAEKARTNTLQPDEMTGGTFTVSNLGMFNIESFTPIINQPEVAILGINTIKETAVKVDGELKFIPMMTLSLTADHRVVDGSVAAQFLNRLKEFIENPNILML
ncbi:MAG: dihydrolipoamide acetyltransferase family protein [Bacillota bacterium]|nr:dihydrolipoamide acetyltransferase family protein [Bacillota bacterium]